MMKQPLGNRLLYCGVLASYNIKHVYVDVSVEVQKNISELIVTPVLARRCNIR
jgi:hypothetical protein